MHIRWASTAVLAVAILVAGCGGDDGGSGDAGDAGGGDGDGVAAGTVEGDGAATGTDQTADDATASACDLLSLDEVSTLFGRDAEVTPVEDAPLSTTSCHWTAEEDLGSGVPTLWQLQLEAYDGNEFFDPDVFGDPQPVEGLGDEAFVADGGAYRGVTAGYRDGDKAVFLSYSIALGDAPDPAEQDDELVEVLRLVHERF